MLTYKRGKGVCNSDTKVVNMYHYYLKNRDSNKTISQPVFTKILNEFHEYKLNQAIYRNIEFDIPYIGKLYINKVEPRIVLKDSNIIIKLPINHKKTKELWEKDPIAKEQKKLIYFLNEESDKYVMKWHWEKNKRLLNKSAYKLKMLRRNKLKITEALRSTNYKIDFFVNPYKNIKYK